MQKGPRGGLRMISRVAAVLAALAFLYATQPCAQGQELYAVVLATVPSPTERPAVVLPSALRGKSLYLRVLRSGGAVSYQLALGFFDKRDDAEKARQQLATSFRDSRVVQVNPQERDNLEKAARAAKPAPP